MNNKREAESVIGRLRARWPQYRWHYRPHRFRDECKPTYEAVSAGRTRVVACAKGSNRWCWTDSGDVALELETALERVQP